MGCKVILTPQAIADLHSIVVRIAADNPAISMSFGNILIERALSIGSFPKMGRIVPEIGETSVRELIHGDYRVIYELRGDAEAVYILRFWHGARGTPPSTEFKVEEKVGSMAGL